MRYVCMILVVGLVAGLAACGGGGSGDVEKFVSVCVDASMGEATEDECRCVGEALQKELSSEDFSTIVDFMSLAGEAENDPEKAMELMEKMSQIDEATMAAMESAGQSCQ
ncbi:MAG: hypothetical protein D6E12_04235 [Desulfovibrio sp.]|mgnify:CR=1 FL=1|nr:MAG: hypothetical protein D6E12_04235 [Desulfovibrio sp.]